MKLTAASLFQDNMVLQRGKTVRIWGTSEPFTAISVRIQGLKEDTESDSSGNWQVTLPELKASVSETLRISTQAETLTLHNIAVGEVWMAGGQSNMEFYMYYDKDYEAVLSMCDDPLIRFYDVPRIASEEHAERFSYEKYGFWRQADEQNLKYFSAVAYYFARALRADLNVPIGIIGCNWGGTRSCCWMDQDTLMHSGSVWMEDYEKGLASIPDIQEAREAYFTNPMSDPDQVFDFEMRNKLMKGVSPDELMQMFEQFEEGGTGNYIGPWHEWRPCALYDNMVKTVMPFTLRGVIYYQGESDEDHPDIYADMLEGLIECWRRGFADELPFLMTQLAPLGEMIGQGGKYYPVLREQQKLAAQKLKKVWCASIGDVGDLYDIHPKKKRPVGERLAMLARGHVYNEKVLCDAPYGVKLTRKDNCLIINCEHAEGGLYISDNMPAPIQIFDPFGNQISETEYEVSVLNDKIIIMFNDEMASAPCRVEFAQTPFYKVNIYNMASIPAVPFTVTEDDKGTVLLSSKQEGV